MKLISQSHEIICLPDNLLKIIELAGRTCYKSEGKITDESAKGFVTRLIDRKHLAMVEFGDVIVKFITNRGVTHELVRHRLCSFAQESTRYVKYDGEMEFIEPVWVKEKSQLAWSEFYDFLLRTERTYKELLILGWKAQQAREVLPNALKTEIVVKANVREWRHILELRCAPTAHPQMRALMIPLLRELKEKLPVVFDDVKEE